MPRQKRYYDGMSKGLFLANLKMDQKIVADRKKWKEEHKADHRHKWMGGEKLRFIGYFQIRCTVEGCNETKACYGKDGDKYCR